MRNLKHAFIGTFLITISALLSILDAKPWEMEEEHSELPETNSMS